jgi:phosphoribosylanthranilate isomerase
MTMSDIRVKICGVSRDEDIAAVNRALPDYVGFVFAPSTRQVTSEVARRLRARLDGRVIPVGVFVEEAPARIAELYERGTIAAAQLHGSYRPRQIRELRERCGPGLTIIRAVAVGEGFAPGLLNIPKDVDYPLLDYPQPGSGKRFDWSLLARMTRPYFLAGGVGLANLDEALALNPFCVDVSSGVETDGVKDSRKIDELVERVRRA